MIIIKIIYGVLLFLAGAAIIKYRNHVHDFVGNWYWAEKYIGNGGTIIVLIILALFLMFLGVTYPFGGLDLFLGGGSELQGPDVSF